MAATLRPARIVPATLTLARSLQRRPTHKVSFWGEGSLWILGLGASLEAKSFVRGTKIDPPGAQRRVFDLKCASCGRDRRCTALPCRVLPIWSDSISAGHMGLLSVKQPFYILVFGLDQELVTKGPENWFTGLIFTAFCTIC